MSDSSKLRTTSAERNRTYKMEQMVIGDLNEAILEPARESLRTRRRRAAFAAVVDELDDLISDVDDE